MFFPGTSQVEGRFNNVFAALGCCAEAVAERSDSDQGDGVVGGGD